MPASRTRLAGVRMVLRYNWPLYLTGVAATGAAAAVASAPQIPGVVRHAGLTGAVAGTWLSAASLVATWWAYDHSELYRWTWLERALPDPPRDWLVVHAGLDEASPALRERWPQARGATLDVHAGRLPMTASLARARRVTRAGHRPDGAAEIGEAGQLDAVVAFLSAHELRRRADRDQLIRELTGPLRPGGRLVIVEHVRDVRNAIAYGPAVTHFLPSGEWRRAIRQGGLEIVHDERLTPFLLLLAAERPWDPTSAPGEG
jgi:hypothetical protein